MIEKKSGLLVRAKNVLNEGGYRAFIQRALTFPLRRLPNWKYERYYVYEHHIKERNEAEYLPKIKDFSLHIVTSNEQAKELARMGFNIFQGDKWTAYRLYKGAIALCIFSGYRLCHIGWMALDEEAKNTFDNLPYPVDFSRQACTGGTMTIPEFEGKGLMTYGYYKRFEYLRSKGIQSSRNAVARDNRASQKVHEKFGPLKRKAYYFKIGRRRFWRETPLLKPQ